MSHSPKDYRVMFVCEEHGWVALLIKLGESQPTAIVFICDSSGNPNTLAFMDPEMGDIGRKLWDALQTVPLFIGWKRGVESRSIQKVSAN